MTWLLVSLLIFTFILLGAGFCFFGENGLIIARIVCGFLWWKGCSEHNEKKQNALSANVNRLNCSMFTDFVRR